MIALPAHVAASIGSLGPEGRAWVARAPRLVEECAERWSLRLGQPFAGGVTSYVAPAGLADGTRAVLKVGFPDDESACEAEALAHYDGEGACRLLAHDRERHAFLLERLEPGTSLWTLPDEDEANELAADVLRKLWRPPPPDHPFDALADRAAGWMETVSRLWRELGRPFERTLLEEAAGWAHDLIPTQGEQVVVHQDFHQGNVLAAEREPWLAIDPKPLVGEREFDLASLLRDRPDELLRDPDPAGRIRRRVDRLASKLDLDRERVCGWGVVHAVGWGLGPDGVHEAHFACARWLSGAARG
jgi:streptomycin 6-kinase